MLVTDPLTFSYPGSESLHFEPIELGPGEALLILGASGTGKSTWLQLLAGHRRPEKGKVFINGKDFTVMSAAERDAWRGEHLGFVFQEQHFVPSLSALDNLRLPFLHQSFPSARAMEMAKRFGIHKLLYKKPQHLSQGEKQRLGILRALLPKPALVLADEPSSSLDDLNCATLVHLLKEESSASGSALVVVTHDQRLKASFERRLHR